MKCFLFFVLCSMVCSVVAKGSSGGGRGGGSSFSRSTSRSTYIVPVYWGGGRNFDDDFDPTDDEVHVDSSGFYSGIQLLLIPSLQVFGGNVQI